MAKKFSYYICGDEYSTRYVREIEKDFGKKIIGIYTKYCV